MYDNHSIKEPAANVHILQDWYYNEPGDNFKFRLKEGPPIGRRKLNRGGGGHLLSSPSTDSTVVKA